ncbi:CASP-like protein 2C1 [Hibiscus syriacus]|uniref:CASP-like protein n=1 Tax=Hibiscus syriacus TaxID=106335 RepID=A0A6A3A6Z2_HIBSY|nr:CASP-like protein XL3 [Hibiscus syriacus]KAE8700140.1 CASP-like protein 2C1 [Hibiscus syriacus]
MGSGIQKMEALLRLTAISMLVLTACLVGFDSQTKVVFYIEKKASFKDLRALVGLVYVTSLAAAYNLLQLSCSSFSARCKGSSLQSCTYLAWLRFVLDQAAVYVVFAGNLAATEHALLVVTGEENFQWVKWCGKYSRFCVQIGGSLLCGFGASVAMIFIASISAFNLFRLYSPTKFMHLKPKS